MRMHASISITLNLTYESQFVYHRFDFTAVKPAKNQLLTDALDEALSTGEKVDDDDDMDYHDFVLIKFDMLAIWCCCGVRTVTTWLVLVY